MVVEDRPHAGVLLDAGSRSGPTQSRCGAANVVMPCSWRTGGSSTTGAVGSALIRAFSQASTGAFAKREDARPPRRRPIAAGRNHQQVESLLRGTAKAIPRSIWFHSWWPSVLGAVNRFRRIAVPSSAVGCVGRSTGSRNDYRNPGITILGPAVSVARCSYRTGARVGSARNRAVRRRASFAGRRKCVRVRLSDCGR